MVKVYGLYGYREATIHIALGSGAAILPLEFKRGNPQHGAYYRPATYISPSAVEQRMIEDSLNFKNGQIVLVNQYGEEEQVTAASADEARAQAEAMKQAETRKKTEQRTLHGAAAKSAASKAAKAEQAAAQSAETKETKETKSYPGVTAIEDVRNILKAAGAKAAVLMDEQAMKAWAQENGIEFPDYSF